MKLSPKRTDLLWGPPSLLSKGYPARIHHEYRGHGVKITSYVHLVPRLVTHGTVPALLFGLLICLHALHKYNFNLPPLKLLQPIDLYYTIVLCKFYNTHIISVNRNINKGF